MTSIANTGSNPLSLLWALQHRPTSGAGGPGAAQGQWPNAQTASAAGSSSSTQRGAASANGVTGSTGSNIDPNTMFIFMSVQEQQSAPQGAGSSGLSNAAQDLFNSIDTDGDGAISQSELEKAVAAAGGTTDQADALLNKLSSGGGSVNESQLASALKQLDGHHRHHHHWGSGGPGGTGAADDAGGDDPLASLLSGAKADGATSQQTPNADGSTTTTLTYPDGTTLTLTTPAGSGSASSTAGDGATSTAVGQNPQNMEQMLATLIKLQAAMAQPPQIAGLAA